MLTIGWTGLAAAASLTIDQTSCFWPATRRAGLNFSDNFDVEDILRREDVFVYPVNFLVPQFLLPEVAAAALLARRSGGRNRSCRRGRVTERTATVAAAVAAVGWEARREVMFMREKQERERPQKISDSVRHVCVREKSSSRVAWECST